MNIKLPLLSLATGVLCASTQAQTVPPATAPAAPTGGTPAAPTRPQAAPAPFATVGGFALSGYLRSRVENWDFFEGANGDGSYTYSGHQLRLSGVRTSPKFDVQIDLQQQLLTNLPKDAFLRPNATTTIPLGLGATYRTANGNQDGALNLKQGFVRFKNTFGNGSTARLGRFEFGEGTEIVAKDPTINWVKTQRTAQRLIGTFGFSHTGRAFDGGQISAPLAGGNLTVVGARPTEGVFQLEANDNIDSVDFLYGAYSKPMENADARLFGMFYEDGREASKSVKTDNRPLAARQADNDKLKIYTLGANYIRTIDVSSGKFDVLAWGALQTGKWGTLDHSGNAIALEAGYQPKNVKLKPWIRLGYYRASGDGNAADGKHKTFYTPLSTPRVYSRFPFYNQMNSEDLTGQLILRPNPKANLRFEAHSVRLNNSNDLFYSGGGAYQDSGFGIGGRPSGGSSKLATVFDASLDYTFNPKTSLGFYFGRALGGKVIENTYTTKKNANLAFVELTKRF